MPRPRIRALPMTSAQRQARRRARLGREPPPQRRRRGAPATAATVGGGGSDTDRFAGRISRAWLDNLPASLEGSRLSEKLQAITELDLEELHAIDPPRGYGRD